MWWMFAPVALADAAAPGESSTCAQPELDGTMPADGDLGVSPDAVIALLFSNTDCGGAFFEGELMTDLGGPLTFQIEQDGDLLRVVPEEPFAVGDVVHLAGFTTAGPMELTFTVGEEGLAMSDEPLAVEVEADPRCDGLEYTRLSGSVQLERSRSGLLQTTVVTEGVSAGWVMAGLVDGRRELTFSHDVLGTGREHCVDARLLDETGAVVWEVEGGCASTEACPAEERSRSEASGCSTTGTAPGGVGLAFALLVGCRRRR